ncbi:MAG: cytochrome c oxidase subunit [Candidatus Binataceae bacterium]|jgi:cytochrome c oxidase subunit II|nr:cytochrome c oxidase subunit [Candidatus Binataceae bacterium]
MNPPRNINFRRASLTAALLAMAAAIAGCASNGPYPLDTLSPKSDLTREILNLFKLVTVLDSIVLLVVIGAMIGAIFIYSSREGDPGEPSAMHHDITLETLWTVIPAVILVAITVPTVHTIIRTQPDKWPADTLEVKVIAHQWWWEFQYPTLGVETGDEVHIPSGRAIHFAMTSKDVIHSFFMPSIGGKRDVIPGQENQITLVADTPGEYYGQCTEFCGTSHANMRFRVFVDTPADFDKWVAHQNEAPVKPTEGPAAAGAKIWADAPCAICHTIKGVSGFSKEYTYGFRGPDLTHFGSRGTLAGSILENTPKNVALWIRDPDSIKPGANMPTLGIDDQKLSDLVAYLESLK